jgi:hypothetical protein
LTSVLLDDLAAEVGGDDVGSNDDESSDTSVDEETNDPATFDLNQVSIL